MGNTGQYTLGTAAAQKLVLTQVVSIVVMMSLIGHHSLQMVVYLHITHVMDGQIVQMLLMNLVVMILVVIIIILERIQVLITKIQKDQK